MYNVFMNLFDNPGGQPENGYICFYKNRGKGQRCEVFAISSYQAQQKAAVILKAKKAYDIVVVLAEQAGEVVTHRTSDL